MIISKVKSNATAAEYEIILFEDLKEVVRWIRNRKFSKVGIIADRNTKKLFSERITKKLRRDGIKTQLFFIKEGESSKNLKTAEEIMEKMLKSGFDRNSLLLALGGGVVGDLTGFIASVYMRGIKYIQIPTTLLAMVDSSIGHKTGVDLKNGKNCCGSFYPPEAVFINISFLDSLPKKEIMNGLAECIKYGVIYDKGLFEYIESNIKEITEKDKKIIEKIVRRCVKIKSKIVSKDEREKDLRKILNFGHTIGHALETMAKYKISHGEAIASGMIHESKIANKVVGLKKDDLQRIENLIEKVGFKKHFKEKKLTKLIDLMRRDKKNLDKKIVFVLPSKIGKMKKINGRYSIKVDEKIIKKILVDYI